MNQAEVRQRIYRTPTPLGETFGLVPTSFDRTASPHGSTVAVDGSLSASPHLNGYPTKVVASNRMQPKIRRQPRGWGLEYNGKARATGYNTRPLPELFQEGQEPYPRQFIAVTVHNRKHGIRLIGELDNDQDTTHSVRGRRIYDEAVREAVIVVWEATDRICWKRPKSALPHLVDSLERHGHLDRDAEVRGPATGCQCRHSRPSPETYPSRCGQPAQTPVVTVDGKTDSGTYLQ